MRGRVTFVAIMILAACAPWVARAGPPTGAAVPQGSYTQTCSNIAFDPTSQLLSAMCAPVAPGGGIAQALGAGAPFVAALTTNLQINNCDPAADIDNINGHLQCKALAGTWGQGAAAPNGSYQQSCEYWTVNNQQLPNGSVAITLNANCWTYANGRIDYTTGNGWVNVQLDLTQCSMAGDIQNHRGQLLCEPASLGPPPTPGPPQNLQTSNSGSGIRVSWTNPYGVLKATVSRTPNWPSGTGALNVGPPRDYLQDELAVSGQAYSYNVCLNFQAGNACASVTGQLPASASPVQGPPHINHQINQHVVVGMETPPGGQTPPAPPHRLNPGAGRLATQIQTGLCKPGFVWRQAYAGDHVCVTPQARQQAASDNQSAPPRRTASGQCVKGYVWRQANPQDHVCVTPQTRARTAQENASAATHTR
jgi:hypothetical protein